MRANFPGSEEKIFSSRGSENQPKVVLLKKDKDLPVYLSWLLLSTQVWKPSTLGFNFFRQCRHLGTLGLLTVARTAYRMDCNRG